MLTGCSNAAANLWHIDYNCIPERVNTLETFEFCLYNLGVGNNVFTDNQGIIQTPNYPVSMSNLDCSLVYNSKDQIKLISIYALFINLESVASSKEWVNIHISHFIDNLIIFEFISIGNRCQGYYVQINDEKKRCGVTNLPTLIHQSCSNTFTAKIKAGTKSYKGVKLFYEGKLYQTPDDDWCILYISI